MPMPTRGAELSGDIGGLRSEAGILRKKMGHLVTHEARPIIPSGPFKNDWQEPTRTLPTYHPHLLEWLLAKTQNPTRAGEDAVNRR